MNFKRPRLMKRALLITLSACMAFLVSANWLQADDKKKEDENQLKAYRAGTIIPMEGPAIKGGVLLVKDGKIENILKADEKLPDGVKAEDMGKDSVILPSFINPYTQVNLLGSNVKGSRSGVTRGYISASTRDGSKYKAFDQIQSTAKIFNQLAQHGYGTLGVIPSYRYILSGRATIIDTIEAKDKKEMALSEDAFLAMQYTIGRTAKSSLEAQFKKALETAKKIREERANKNKKPAAKPTKPEAKKPPTPPKPSPRPPIPSPRPPSPVPIPGRTVSSKPPTKPTSSSKKPKPTVATPLSQVFLGERKAVVIITIPSAIDHFVKLVKTLPEKFKFTLVTAPILEEDQVKRIASLKDHLEGVVLEPYISRISDTTIYINTARYFAENGVNVSLIPMSDDARGHKDIFYFLANMVKSGMDPEAALKSITLNPAKMLGIEKKRGSLAKGRDANFVIFDKDPLSGMAEVKKSFSRGKIVFPVPEKKDEEEK